MDALAPFRIPMSALKADSSSYEWNLGPEFFAAIDGEHEPPKGVFNVKMEMERTGGVITMDFVVVGNLSTTCDRCQVPIEMPIDHDYQLIVKFGDPAESTDEVIVLDSESADLNVGEIIYDFILLAIPISHRITECETLENPPCDMTIVRYLNENKVEQKDPEETLKLWDQLRKAIDN
jgi:uncharacterized metal-binding protein YceD (DUF177 family)